MTRELVPGRPSQHEPRAIKRKQNKSPGPTRHGTDPLIFLNTMPVPG